MNKAQFCQRRLFTSEVLKRQLLQICYVSKNGGNAHENFFYHPIGPNNPQGLSDGKKCFFGCKNLNMST